LETSAFLLRLVKELFEVLFTGNDREIWGALAVLGVGNFSFLLRLVKELLEVLLTGNDRETWRALHFLGVGNFSLFVKA